MNFETDDLPIYPYVVHYKSKDIYLLWQTSYEGDCFLLSDKKKIFLSDNKEEVDAFMENIDRTLNWQEAGEIDLELFFSCVKKIAPGISTSEEENSILIDGWNFLDDIYSTLESEVGSLLFNETLNRAYNKIFYGNNLPSVTPDNCKYEPIWLAHEVSELNKAFTKIFSDVSEILHLA